MKFFCWLIHTVLLSVTISTAFAANSAQPSVTLGIRAGEDTFEGYSDFIIPITSTDSNLIFLNPRLSFSDEQQNEINVGLGVRQVISDFVLGGNFYFDSRESSHGNRFNQWGFGFELLSEWGDARFNWYDADNDLELIRSAQSTETIKSYYDVTSNSVSYGQPYASDHGIAADRFLFSETIRKTTTKTTTRIFNEYESGMDGWDAEIGIKIPIPQGPEARIFCGYYDYDNNFGDDINGLKGRFEIRTGPFLALDAEVYENDELNDTNLFIGARIQIPFTGKNTLSSFWKGLISFKHSDTSKRMVSEMVMRDVRIQTTSTGMIENLSKKQVAQSETSDVISKLKIRKKTNLVDGITFVDKDNATDKKQDGSAKHPYADNSGGIQKGINNAGKNKIIFVDEADNGGTYNEHVTLKDGQTLTSEIVLPKKFGIYRATSRPVVKPTSGSSPVITMADNTILHRMEIDGTSVDVSLSADPYYGATPVVYAPRGLDGRKITITENIITTANNFDSGIYIDNRLIKNSTTHIQSNKVITNGKRADGIFLNFEESSNTITKISSNTLSTLGADSHGILIYDPRSTNHNINVNDNSIMTSSVDSNGIYFESGQSVNSNIVFNNNNITTAGTSSHGLEFYCRTSNNMNILIDSNTISSNSSGNDDSIYMDNKYSNDMSISVVNNKLSTVGLASIGISLINDNSSNTSSIIVNNLIVTQGNFSHGISHSRILVTNENYNDFNGDNIFQLSGANSENIKTTP